REMLPRVDQGQFILRANLPPGTRLEVTDRTAQRIERVLQAIPEVQDVTVTIGSSKERKAEELLETLGSHQAQILVNLKPRFKGWGWGGRGDPRFRTRKTAQIVQELKETLGREPLEGAQIEYLLQESVFKSAFLGGAPIVMEVKGTELNRLEGLAEETKGVLGHIPGLYGVQSSLVPPSPETKVRVMKDRAASYHLTVSDIALTAQTALKGFVATKFKEEGREIDIRVRLRKEDRQDLSRVRRLLLHSSLEVDVPLAEVAYFSVGKGPTEIRHVDQQRAILLSAQLFGRPLAQTLQQVTRRLKELKVPAGYSVALTGESEQMQESFRSLAFALLLSVILVYMVMASEFESLWQPFLIMGTIPMGIIGVVLALWLTGTPVSVMTLLGIIILGGLVVDDGIVLVDYINLLKGQGMDAEEAVVLASERRLRPILMTSGTTVLGLLPLALGLGEGVELQGPMAITVMGGMTVCTFLTLIFLPTLYLIADRFFSRFRRPAIEEPQMAAAPAPVLAGVQAEPLPSSLPLQPSSTVDLPDIPSDFGGEEAVPEKSDFPTFPFGESLRPPPQSPPPASQPAPMLNPRQQQMLDHLKSHERITRKEYVQLTGASVPTAARDLKELMTLGLIRGFGPFARGRYYRLAESS
ncbi:MAG: efflux RND transporter permease subunit, partial [Candidatus Omnitrophica bacterium]|nr:efflux RND transporter permease subunit [Candidatus Omnitrophota bacterium]